MVFQLGLEFQEVNSLCKWALNDYNIQKKPLFIISYQEKPLWHVVIDTNDIEFVTVPFAGNKEENDLLSICIDSISKSFEILVNLLGEYGEISFQYWIEGIKSVLYNDELSIYFTNEYELIKDKSLRV